MDTEQEKKVGTKDNEPIVDNNGVVGDMSALANGRLNVSNVKAGTKKLALVDRNEDGVISSYRYVANKELRINQLNQEYRISKVLPETFAMSTRKVNGIHNNNSLASMIISMMEKDYPEHKDDYVEISLDNEDTSLLYKMIPKRMRVSLFNKLKQLNIKPAMPSHSGFVINLQGLRVTKWICE